MKTLSIICDNHAYRQGLISSWGLSIGLKDEGGWTLFDVGNDPGVFLHNFRALGGNLEQVRRIILSHLHYDHTGGLGAFQAMRKPIELYLPQSLIPEDKQVLEAHSFHVVTVPPKGLKQDNLWILPIPGGTPVEQLLVLETEEGIHLLTGCAHYGIERGLLAVWEQFHRPFTLVCGGFHLAFRPRQETKQVLKAFQLLPIRSIAPCHCTGDKAIAAFQRTFPEKFLRVGAGWHTSL